MLGVAAVVFAGLLVWRFDAYLDRPAGGGATSVIEVERGATIKPILDQLAADGVLERPRWLYWYARLAGTTEIRAGRYEIAAQQSPLEIAETLHRGQVRMATFTIAEGLNRWQVRDVLVAGGWMDAEQFEVLCDDRAFLEKHDIPGPTCDGYLYPETYKLARGVAPEAVFAAMLAAHSEAFAAATKNGRGPLDLDHRELVTLASIVEKETSAPVERPRIACVFYNRLTAKPTWRLDTDPTVIYAATLTDPAFDGNLKRSHLRKLHHPYNTYKVTGLPPGPIANPGEAALSAVVSPSSCRDFFFVSKNNGTHQFCPTLDCHNRAVQKWQIDYFRRGSR
jgi:UPF0755 protein